jgi:hypothetical protein
MPKAGFIVARVSFLVLAASMLGVAMLAAPAVGQSSGCAPPSGKCFAVAVSPSNPVAGVSTSFMFTITNEASTQQLGSVQISAPAGSTITGASLFLNLSLAPGHSTTLTVSATMSSCSPGSTYQWGIEAKQSNDFNGTGNDFQLDSTSATNLKGSCSLQPCTPTACSAQALSATTIGTVTISGDASGKSITTGMESPTPGSGFDFSCPGTYKPVSDTFGFAVFDTATGEPLSTLLNVTFRVRKPLVNTSTHPGASSWQICYASTSTFTSRTGSLGSVTIGGVTYNTGLLPDCSSTPVAPCVQSRNKNNAGDVIVTFLAFGDPFAHG